MGGAALGTLVLMANEQELSHRALHATMCAERARGERLFAETERLQKELYQVKLELKLELDSSRRKIRPFFSLIHHQRPGGPQRPLRQESSGHGCRHARPMQKWVRPSVIYR